VVKEDAAVVAAEATDRIIPPTHTAPLSQPATTRARVATPEAMPETTLPTGTVAIEAIPGTVLETALEPGPTMILVEALGTALGAGTSRILGTGSERTLFTATTTVTTTTAMIIVMTIAMTIAITAMLVRMIFGRTVVRVSPESPTTTTTITRRLCVECTLRRVMKMEEKGSI
jgi:hypothetical protein